MIHLSGGIVFFRLDRGEPASFLNYRRRGGFFASCLPLGRGLVAEVKRGG